MMKSRSAIRKRTVSWPIVVIGAAGLLGGCVGEPATFSKAQPIVLEPRMAAPARPVGPVPVMSRAAKERLFRDFQRSQNLKATTVTVEGDGAP